MLIKVNKLKVDVAHEGCASRDCFSVGFDKGSFSQGRGYTDYHSDARGRRVERPVCATRHYHGCPDNSVCGTCHTVSVMVPGERCDRYGCGGTLIAQGDPS